MSRHETLSQPKPKSPEKSQRKTVESAEPTPEKVYQQFVAALRRTVEKSPTPDEALEAFVAHHFKKVPQQIVDLAVQRSGIDEPVMALTTMMKKRMAADGVTAFAERPQADPEQQFSELIERVVADIRAGADPDTAIKSAVDKISKSPNPDYLPNQGSAMTVDLQAGETIDPAEDLRLRISADYRLTDVRNEIWQKSQLPQKESKRRRGKQPDEAKIRASEENPIQVYREFVKAAARQIEDGRDANDVIEAALDEYLRNPIRATPREDLKKRMLAEARIVKAIAANPPKKEKAFSESPQVDPEKEFSTIAEIIADGIRTGVPRKLAITRAVDAYAKFDDLENLMGAGSEMTLMGQSLEDLPSVRDQVIAKLDADGRIIAASNEVNYGSRPQKGRKREVAPAPQPNEDLLAADFSQIPDQRVSLEYISRSKAFPYLKKSALENMRSGGMNGTDAIKLAVDHFIQKYGDQVMQAEASRLTLPAGGRNTPRQDMELLLSSDSDIIDELNRQREWSKRHTTTRPTYREPVQGAVQPPLRRPEAPTTAQPAPIPPQPKKPSFFQRIANGLLGK